MKTIKIFLASSSELKTEREQFEIFIGRKNKILLQQNIYLELIIWEDFIDTLSKTRLQDEYNKAIRECDIFLSLFFTKVGKFTKEEFETAFKHFHENDKPKIYTYFKQGNINLGQINFDDFKNLNDFQNTLKELGHFQTNFETTDGLLKHFNEQLDKIDFEDFNKKVVKKAYFDEKKFLTEVPSIDLDAVIGREQSLSRIHDEFKINKRLNLVNPTIAVGKTTIANAYVLDGKYNADYENIAWVTFSSNFKTSLLNAFAHKNYFIAQKNVSEDKLIFDLIEKLKNQKGNNLLVIDNVEDTKELLEFEQNFNTITENWKILFTSRLEIEGVEKIEIEFLNPQNAQKLFLIHLDRNLKKDEENDLQDVLILVDFHTLTIVLLAKFTKEKNWNIAQVLEMLKAKDENIEFFTHLKEELNQLIEKQENKVYQLQNETLTIFQQNKLSNYVAEIFDNIEFKEQTLKYLRTFALLPKNEEIEKDLLIELFAPNDKKEFLNILQELTKYSFISEKNGKYKIHYLVQLVLIEKLNPSVYYDEIKIYIQNVMKKLDYDRKENPIYFLRFTHFGDSILNNLKEYHKLILDITYKILTIYFDLKNYQLTKHYVNNEYLKKLNIIHELELAKRYSDLAILNILIKKSNSKILYLEHLQTSLKTLKKIEKYCYKSIFFQMDKARVTSNIGEFYFLKEEYERALKYYQSALEIKLTYLDNKIHREVGTEYKDLAKAHLKLKNLPLALDNINESIFIYEKVLSEKHPSRADVYFLSAKIHFAKSLYSEAKIYNEKCLAIYKEVLHHEHEDLKNALILAEKIEISLR